MRLVEREAEFAGLLKSAKSEAKGAFGNDVVLLEKAIAERGIEVVLLFGARNPGELLYAEDFEAFADKHPGFRFVPCYSRQMPTHPRDDDFNGYVQDALPQFAPNPETDVAYLCGNPNMVDACFEALKALEFGVRQVRREKYVSSR